MAADLATAQNAIPLCTHLRALTGWGDTQLKVHLARLAELEYLLVHRVKTGQGFEYELLYDGEGAAGARFMMGLAAADGQACGYDAPRSGVEEARSPPGRGVVAAPSAPGRPQKTAIIPAKTANASTRPGTRGRFSGARRRNRCCKAPISSMPWSVEKTPSKTPPARPISTTIRASKSATKSTSIYTTICATTWPNLDASVLCSDRQNPVLRPVPGSRIPEGAQAVKGGPRQRPLSQAARSPKGKVLARPST